MITKTQIEQQKQAIEGLYEKVMEAPDSVEVEEKPKRKPSKKKKEEPVKVVEPEVIEPEIEEEDDDLDDLL